MSYPPSNIDPDDYESEEVETPEFIDEVFEALADTSLVREFRVRRAGSIIRAHTGYPQTGCEELASKLLTLQHMERVKKNNGAGINHE